jgi:hypothetical protein
MELARLFVRASIIACAISTYPRTGHTCSRTAGVQSLWPGDGEEDVPTDAAVRVIVSPGFAPSIVLVGPDGETEVTESKREIGGDTEIVAIPQRSLEPDADYVLRVDERVIRFRTGSGSAPESTSPVTAYRFELAAYENPGVGHSCYGNSYTRLFIDADPVASRGWFYLIWTWDQNAQPTEQPNWSVRTFKTQDGPPLPRCFTFPGGIVPRPAADEEWPQKCLRIAIEDARGVVGAPSDPVCTQGALLVSTFGNECGEAPSTEDLTDDDAVDLVPPPRGNTPMSSGAEGCSTTGAPSMTAILALVLVRPRMRSPRRGSRSPTGRA